jgi:nitrile hydratase accessory protein
LSRPDFAASERLPRDAEGPVFAEPWQAQAFALAVELHARGAFTWPEWASALSEELREAHDDGSRYYEHWLAALEKLALARRLTESSELAALKAAWADAYAHTPHGQPVALRRST